jgi:ubiquinone/menaquinone biosynthesis C-methylase UbiE
MGQNNNAVIEKRRPHYEALIEKGASAFFEEERKDCPFCGSGELRQLLRTRDRFQRKPGLFRLDECAGCGLVFQNPRLGSRGLNYYYSDYYEGLGAEATERYYGLGQRGKARKARRVAGLVQPHHWLDVGGGNGSFCAAAAQVWPDARFEVLDSSSLAQGAVAKGRAAEVHSQPLVDAAHDMAGRYDVITMHHYLEHTTDPEAEAAAAHRALADGGILVVEVPDPESRYGRLMKSYWWQWLQPQHLHLFPVAAMTKLLERNGFQIVRVERAEAHIPVDFVSTMALIGMRLMPVQVAPWTNAKGGWRGAVRHLMFIAFLPLLALARAGDLAWAPLARRGRHLTNVYAVIARRG